MGRCRAVPAVVSRPGRRVVNEMSVIEEIEGRIREALRPSFTERARAKELIRALVSDEEPHGVGEIQRVLIEVESVSPPDARNNLTEQTTDFDSLDDIRSRPSVRYQRYGLAAGLGAAELESLGFLMQVADFQSPLSNPIVAGRITVGYEYRGRGAGVHIETHLPSLPSGYRVAPRYRDEAKEWFFDPDIFVSDLASLDLAERTKRCLREAIDCHRSGQYLACANLLGAASEGAWFSAAGKLVAVEPTLEKKIDNKNLKPLISSVVEVLNRTGGKDATPGLQAQAEVLRRLRNYGTHPRDEASTHVERYLGESGTGALLMQTHSYLVALGLSVEGSLSNVDAS